MGAPSWITLAHFCRPRPLGLLLVLNSEKLVLEQHSITFASFCCPRPPLGLLPVLPVLNSEKKLVWESGSWIQDRGTRILDHGSWIQDP